MKIAIVEDYSPDVRSLEGLLRAYCLREKIDLNLSIYSSGEDFLEDWPLEFDVVFLDIQMERLNGIDVASKIRETNERVVIVFVTNDPQHSLEGYSVDALDYLLKPATSELVEIVLKKAIRRLGNTERKCITIHNNEGYFVVNPMDITYIELEHRKLIIHTLSGEISSLKSMQYMEEQLPEVFFRCHSAFLINLHAVESVKGSTAVVAGQLIPISKHRRKEFLSALTVLIGEKI